MTLNCWLDGMELLRLTQHHLNVENTIIDCELVVERDRILFGEKQKIINKNLRPLVGEITVAKSI